MTKYRFVLIPFFAVLFFCFKASAQSSDYPRTVIDGAGRKLILKTPPERLVTYYNDSFGMLATFGVMPVAQSVNAEMLVDPIYFGEAGKNITTIPYTDAPDLEAVIAAKPDLVFVYSEEEAQALEGLATAFVTPDPATLEELYDAVRLYGQVLAREADAEAAIAAFQARYAAYKTLASSDDTILKLGVMDDGKFYISTIDDPLCRILNAIARCDWEKATPDEYWGYETTAEGVLALDPDIIILNNWSSMSRDDMLAALEADPLWNKLSAVQTGRVVGTPGYENPIASSLPAAQKFLDTYLPLIYPDIFPEPLTDEQVQAILAEGDAGVAAGDGFPLAITDRLGGEVTLDRPAERIFCLSEPCLHSLAALDKLPAGAWPYYHRFVLSDPALFGERATQIPVLDGFESVDLEAVAALDPDLIIAWPGYEDYLPQEFVSTVAPVLQASYDLMMPDINTLGHDLRMVATAVGRADAAEAILEPLEARQAAYLRVLGETPRREVLVIRLEAPDTNSIWALPCGPLMAQITTCVNTTGDWFQYSPESLLAADPEVLIVEDWGANDGTFAPSTWSDAGVPLWNEIPAVSEGRMHYVPVIATAPYSPIAWGQTLDTLMPLLYPDLFPNGALTDQQAQEILAEN